MTRQSGYQRNTSAASAQRVRETTEQMTNSQSLTLVKNLVRISISTVCHIRNIFPSTCFQERSYAGMHIYQLDAATRDDTTRETVVHNQEAYQLTQWLEYGVFEAVERRYLRRMELIILSEGLNRPHESYSFDLDYPDEENDSAVVIFSGTRVTTVENSKTQLVKLIRSLIQFSNTLEEVPSERGVTMKLWYHDERTPTDWEPTYFEAANPEDLSFVNEGDHDTLRIRIGELRTPHHTLKVRFQGVVDNPEHETKGEGSSVQETEEVRGMKEITESDVSNGEEACIDNVPTRSKLGGLLVCETGRAEVSEEESDEETQQEAELEAEPCQRKRKGRGVSRVVSEMENLAVTQALPKQDEVDICDSDSEDTNIMDDIRAWVKKETRPTISGAQKQLRLSKEDAQECFAKMVGEGLLRKQNYRYHTVASASPTCDRDRETSSGDMDDGNQPDDNLSSSSSQSSSRSDDSATLKVPENSQDIHIKTANTTMPPPVGRRRGGRGASPPEGGKLPGNFVTPPVPRHTTMPGMQPVPEKPPQARILSMGTKRVLDEAELSENKETQESDPIDPYQKPDPGASLDFEISLSQASSRSTIRTAKCSLVGQPIRQSKRKRFERLRDESRGRE